MALIFVELISVALNRVELIPVEFKAMDLLIDGPELFKVVIQWLFFIVYYPCLDE